MILGEGLGITAAGVVIGLAAAFALTRIMRQLLFDVAPTDVVTFVAAPAVLLVAAFVACVVPARRAATLDPVEAIRGGGSRVRADTRGRVINFNVVADGDGLTRCSSQKHRSSAPDRHISGIRRTLDAEPQRTGSRGEQRILLLRVTDT